MEIRARKFVQQVSLGSLGVFAVTAGCFTFHPNYSIPSLLYLLVLVPQSLWGGFASSAVVSIVAAACLEYFFIPPVLEWQINDPGDAVALIAYWITCLVITRLASRARREARIAERRRRDAALLYEAASRLLALGPDIAAGAESLRIFREVFALRAVSLYDSESAAARTEGISRHDLSRRIHDAASSGKSHLDPGAGLFIYSLKRGTKIIGAIGFEGGPEDEAVTLPLSALAATALERMQTFRAAGRAAAGAEAEMLRSAILDAFAHEFKTPLAIILAAAGGLRETCNGQMEQMEMTEFIENQTIRLNQLTTRLLQVARLDRDEIYPAMELTGIEGFLNRVAAQCRSQFGREISVHCSASAEMMADPELLGLALIQLLDNACKYSPSGSTVTLAMETEGVLADIRVTNEGKPIPPNEQARIFERFARGGDAEHLAPGTGLGLYVARKIIRAHGGVIQFDRGRSTATITSFLIQLPIYRASVYPAEISQAAAFRPEQKHEQEASQSAGRR